AAVRCFWHQHVDVNRPGGNAGRQIAAVCRSTAVARSANSLSAPPRLAAHRFAPRSGTGRVTAGQRYSDARLTLCAGTPTDLVTGRRTDICGREYPPPDACR